jgi:DnaJ-class molecular chaperone
VVHISFCPRCNTSLENYMQFCWNCGTKQVGGQTYGPQQQRPQVMAPVQQAPPQQQGYYQQGYGVQSQQPYQQSVTVTYGNPQMAMSGPAMQQRNQAIIPCAFCEGEGHHPMNFDQPCPICRGAAKVTVIEPYTRCQQCEGSGKQFATMEQICATCQGKGVIQL